MRVRVFLIGIGEYTAEENLPASPANLGEGVVQQTEVSFTTEVACWRSPRERAKGFLFQGVSATCAHKQTNVLISQLHFIAPAHPPPALELQHNDNFSQQPSADGEECCYL
ncbi:hypothetical protein VNO80_02936 [Phaseolus coccineus]|uniref:Uncharacterized protein n=1 Tax=Phaseolus coccineus TaxID=3886 RepID=A0AAN9RID0_PHACN